MLLSCMSQAHCQPTMLYTPSVLLPLLCRCLHASAAHHVKALVLQAVGMIGMVAYLSYLLGDFMGLSGIVSLFCCSVFSYLDISMPRPSPSQHLQCNVCMLLVCCLIIQ